mgnify:CR=1 FL=1
MSEGQSTPRRHLFVPFSGQLGQQAVKQLLDTLVSLCRPITQQGLHLIRYHGSDAPLTLRHELFHAASHQWAGLARPAQNTVHCTARAVQHLSQRRLLYAALLHPFIPSVNVTHVSILCATRYRCKLKM